MSSLRLAVILVVLAVAGTAFADAFEFLAYTPPAKPWVKQVQPNGAIAYVYVGANNAGGMVLLIPSVTPIGTPTEEFQTYWRANVDPIMKARMPTPQSRPARDMTMVWGSSPIDVGGQRGDVQVVMFVGRNSVLGTVTLTVGPDAVRAVAAFNASVKILDENRPIAKPPEPTQAPPPRPALSPAPIAPAQPAAPAASALGFDYEVPPGYKKTSEGGLVWLLPKSAAVRDAACGYALVPPTTSSGNLEKDVEAAMRQVPAGWNPPDPKYFSNQQKGIGPEGWPYWYKVGSITTIATGAQANAGIVMALGFPAPNNQVNIVYGIGGTECIISELAFERLFQSIKPKGWISDGGKAFTAALQAAYRYVMHSPQFMLLEYAFYPSGRYRSGSGMIAQINWYELTYAGVGDGAWKLDRARVTLTPDAKNRQPESFHVRVVTEWIAMHWRDAVVITKDDDKTGRWSRTYYKVLDQAPADGK